MKIKTANKSLNYMTVIIALMLVVLPLFSTLQAALDSQPESKNPKGPERVAISQINQMNRVHKRSNIWMNITNWGYFGNSGESRREAMDDPCLPGVWASQCEYPGGSRTQYMFMGSLWLGALIRKEGFEYPRVSVGMDGWLTVHELWPGEGATNSQDNGIIERSTLPLQYDCLGNYIGGLQDSAVSEQDFVCSYSDTLTESFYVDDDSRDGPHDPLGVKITQKSYAWTYNYAQNFIIIDWEFENIAGNYLKNLYIGLYIDADIGQAFDNRNRHTDDITGFQKWFYYETPSGELDSSVINTAWIADNDGRENSVASGTDFEAPAVTGVRVVRAPNPKLKTSYNWWISNGDADLDFGPAWKDDGSPGSWTDVYGTPMGDVKKYFVLSNREFDYDQVRTREPDYINGHPQEFRDRWTDEVIESHDWKIPGVDDETPADYVDNIANGFDTRYLLSWGPLGIFDHIDEAGNRIYRLNPGEKFSMTIGYVAGDNFHDRNNPQPNNTIIDHDLFNFNSLRYSADWSARVYDNPMIDTPIHDWGADHIENTGDIGEGDGYLDTGDGWYGEDVGNDGLYALMANDVCYRWVGGTRVEDIYPGPDADGSENDGHLSEAEDNLDRPEYIEYTRRNSMLDFGDGHPDFKGPPPPPAPDLDAIKEPITIQTGPNSPREFSAEFLESHVVLHWKARPSEDTEYKDPFSREMDFEGYRVYVSNTNLERDFALLDEFDQKDWALYYLESDSLASRPNVDSTLIPESKRELGIMLFRQKVGNNIGFWGHDNLIKDTLTNPDDPDYYYIIGDAHPMMPRYYSVTCFDYGDYKTGTASLETARIANSIYLAPSGNQHKAVGVVPNPYRANADYTVSHGGLSWENRDDGTRDFFPQTDRRMYFYNLPKHCLIRIYTVSGDLVDIIPHGMPGDGMTGWVDDYSEAWDLNSRNHQQVVSGMYLFTVEEFDEEIQPFNSEVKYEVKGDIEVGKFVVIR